MIEVDAPPLRKAPGAGERTVAAETDGAVLSQTADKLPFPTFHATSVADTCAVFVPSTQAAVTAQAALPEANDDGETEAPPQNAERLAVIPVEKSVQR